MAAASFIAAVTSASEKPVSLTIRAMVLALSKPFGISTMKSARFAESSSAVTASEAFIDLKRLYVPGWIDPACGLAVYAATKALVEATTPASVRTSPICDPAAPVATVTWTEPVPGPG